jgi:hypothetical protein
MHRMLFLLSLTAATGALAQLPSQAPRQLTPQQGTTCLPDKGPGTTEGRGGDLSDKLAQSHGVICPPSGVDPDVRVPPPAGGDIKIIPPPGTPGGDPSVQPK